MSRDMKVRVVDTGKLEIRAVCTVTDTDFTVVVDHAAWKRWQMGEKAQVAFPDLSPREREFLISGTTPDEWDDLPGEE